MALLSLLLAACGTRASSSPSAFASAAPRPPIVSASATASASASSTSGSAATGGSAVPSRSAGGDQGVSFGEPALIAIGDRNLPAVLVTNDSEQVRTFTVTALWKKGGSEVATAVGAVIDLRPHEQRALNLATQGPSPTDADSVEVHVDRMINAAGSTPNADIASLIQFGKPALRSGGLSSIEVPVTNMDSMPHTFSVGAALLAHGTLIATASGSVNDIGPRLTLPVSLTIGGPDTGYDQMLVYVNSVSQ